MPTRPPPATPRPMSGRSSSCAARPARAFNLDEEPAAVRDAYGRNRFGQGCLLARRLVEQGVPFVEVTLGNGGLGWDSHADNFEAVKKLAETLDPAWATLIEDLRTRGLLDTTLIVWMGEFGRTPKINDNTGRDHFPNAWSTVLAGGGIRGGQAYGRTSDDAMSVADNPVTVPDLLATVCQRLGNRSAKAKRFEPRPADSHRRSGGHADRGSFGMSRPPRRPTCCWLRF